MCNNVDGQCSCRANVIGRRCDSCKESTFGLRDVGHRGDISLIDEGTISLDEKDDGCTQCFCFGRASSCTQAQLIWTQVKKFYPHLACRCYKIEFLFLKWALISSLSSYLFFSLTDEVRGWKRSYDYVRSTRSRVFCSKSEPIPGQYARNMLH